MYMIYEVADPQGNIYRCGADDTKKARKQLTRRDAPLAGYNWRHLKARVYRSEEERSALLVRAERRGMLRRCTRRLLMKRGLYA